MPGASTELVARYGDAEWSDLIGRHEHQLRIVLEQSGGELVKMLGDGSLSVLQARPLRFVAPARLSGRRNRWG
jgi:class 3 adenylate cyclase